MSTYKPTRADAVASAASKERDIIMDRGDLAMMSLIAADIEEHAENPVMIRCLHKELCGFLDFLRLQLP